MQRIVISYPRSGLNWVRFCIEYRFGIRTPGKTLLINAREQPEAAFLRDHDPGATSHLRRGMVENASWLKRPLLRMQLALLKNERVLARPDDILVLLVRDYREVFVRSAAKNHVRYRGYLANLRFFPRLRAEKRRYFTTRTM